MDAGELTQEYVLQRPSGPNADGYADVETVWLRKRLAGGSEALKFGAVQGQGQYVLTLWYRDDVKADWRVKDVLTGATLQIVSYGDPDGERVRLQIFATEVQ